MPVSPNVREVIEDLVSTGDYVITDVNGHVITESDIKHNNLKGFDELPFIYPISSDVKAPEKIIGTHENFDGLIPTMVIYIYGEDEDIPLYFIWE